MGYTKSEQYEYFIGADNALYVCTYTEEDGTFYLGDSQKVSDFGAYINVGEEYIYFGRTDYMENTICRMNFDGTGIEEVCNFEQTDVNFIQYAKLSDGKEYLYYIMENEPGGLIGKLCRYDLSGGEEQLLSEEVIWFNLYEGSLYMTAMGDGDTALLRGDLDGGNQEVLDDKNTFSTGYVEEGQMFLYSVKQEALVVCNLDGVPDTNVKGFYECGLGSSGGTIGGYGDGWVYYEDKEDNAIHRIRTNGTGDRDWGKGLYGKRNCPGGAAEKPSKSRGPCLF